MIHLYCGDGKGKTTAAAGLAVRAAGNRKPVLFLQFMKGNGSGEQRILSEISGITLRTAGERQLFSFRMTKEEREAAYQTHTAMLQQAGEALQTERFFMVVLDEAVTAVEKELLSEEQLRLFVEQFPKEMELVLTGSVPEPWMLEQADYVTDMEKIKHPFDRGISAREGVEF